MNRRSAALYGTLAALGLAGLTIPTLGAQAHPESDAQTSDRERRAVDVREEALGVGISSGLVVVYGHPLHQPYHFEYRGNVLYVNGVQIEPSVVLQRDADKNRPILSADDRKSGEELTAMEESVRRRYLGEKGKSSDADLRAEILATVRAHPRVKDAEWTSDKALIYHPKGRFENNAHAIIFSQRIRPANPNAKTPEQLKQENIAHLEKDLKRGDCLVWGTVGPWHSPEWKCKDFKRVVQQIMGQPSTSDSEKESKLRETFGGGSEYPRDLMSNYNASEWK